jgi:hypothetical protein
VLDVIFFILFLLGLISCIGLLIGGAITLAVYVHIYINKWINWLDRKEKDNGIKY